MQGWFASPHKLVTIVSQRTICRELVQNRHPIPLSRKCFIEVRLRSKTTLIGIDLQLILKNENVINQSHDLSPKRCTDRKVYIQYYGTALFICPAGMTDAGSSGTFNPRF